MAILDGAQAILNSPVPSPDKLVAGDEEISDVDSDDTDILLQHNGDVEEELKDADVEVTKKLSSSIQSGIRCFVLLKFCTARLFRCVAHCLLFTQSCV